MSKSTALVTRGSLGEQGRTWVSLLDRLGNRDIWEFTRAVETKHKDRAQEKASQARVLRSAAKNYAPDPDGQDPKYQHRRDWLLYWIHFYADGRRRTMEELTGYSGSYIAQCLDTEYYGGRSIGGVAARTIEVRLSLPENAMDQPFFPHPDAPREDLDAPLTEVERKWLSLLAGLTDADVREFTIMLYARRQHNLDLMQKFGFTGYPSRPLVKEALPFRNVYQNRRAWLTHCVDVLAGGRRNVMAAMLGVSASAVSQYLSPRYMNGHGISDNLARKMESRLALADGTFERNFHEHRHIIVPFGTEPKTVLLRTETEEASKHELFS